MSILLDKLLQIAVLAKICLREKLFYRLHTYTFITLQIEDYIVVTISIYNFVKESYKFKKTFKVMHHLFF